MPPAARLRKADVQELRRRIQLLPSTLDIYVTNRCNLSCSYCSAKELTAQEQKTLPLETVLRAVDLYASYLSPSVRRACGTEPCGPPAVNFTGGEPFLAYDVMRSTAEYVRRRYPWMKVSVATNGTLLEASQVGPLLDLGMLISVSMDGCKRANDTHRKLRDDPGASAYDAVVRRLRALPPDQMSRIDAGVTMTSATMVHLVETLTCLRDLGFRRICLNFETSEPWDAGKLRLLEKIVSSVNADVRERYLSEIADFPRSPGFRLSDVYFEVNSNYREQDQLTRELILGLDGVFLPSHLVWGETEKRYQLGTLEHGVDFDRLRAVYDEVRSHATPDDPYNIYPSLDRYFSALSKGLDPKAALEEGYRAGKIVASLFGDRKSVV